MPTTPSVPDQAAFVGNYASRATVKRAITVFREQAQFPSQGAALPTYFPGVGLSDQWSFWQEGYPGLMVTDTAMFRIPYYHTPQDNAETLDYDRMARVVSGLMPVIRDCAGSAPGTP